MNTVQTATADLSNSTIMVLPDNNRWTEARKVFSKIEVSVSKAPLAGTTIDTSIVKLYDARVKDFIRFEARYKSNILASAPNLAELLDGVMSTYSVLLKQNVLDDGYDEDWVDFKSGDPKIDQYPCRQVGLYDLYRVSLVTSPIKYIEAENKVIPSEYTLETFGFYKHWLHELKENGYNYSKYMKPILKEKKLVHTTKYTNSSILTSHGETHLYKVEITNTKQTAELRTYEDGTTTDIVSYSPKLVTSHVTMYYDMHLNLVKTIEDAADTKINIYDYTMDYDGHFIKTRTATETHAAYGFRSVTTETHETGDPNSRLIKRTHYKNYDNGDARLNHQTYSETDFKYSDVRSIALENGSIEYSVSGFVTQSTNTHNDHPNKKDERGGSTSHRITVSILSGKYEGSVITIMLNPDCWLSSTNVSFEAPSRSASISADMVLSDGYIKIIARRNLPDMHQNTTATVSANSLNCWTPYGDVIDFIKAVDSNFGTIFTDDDFYSVMDGLVKAIIQNTEDAWKKQKDENDTNHTIWDNKLFAYEYFRGERDGFFIRESNLSATFSDEIFKKITIPTTKFRE